MSREKNNQPFTGDTSEGSIRVITANKHSAVVLNFVILSEQYLHLLYLKFQLCNNVGTLDDNSTKLLLRVAIIDHNNERYL